MAKRPLFVQPPYVKGYKMDEFMSRIPQVAKSDPIYGTDVTSDAASIDIFDIPPDTLVTRTIVQVATASNSTGMSVKLGDSDDDDRYMANATVLPATAGFKASTVPYHYSSAAVMQANVDNLTTATAITQGTLYFLVEYIPNYSKFPQIP